MIPYWNNSKSDQIFLTFWEYNLIFDIIQSPSLCNLKILLFQYEKQKIKSSENLVSISMIDSAI